MPKKSTAMQVSESMDLRRRLPCHDMTDLACTYPILNRLILNGFQTMLWCLRSVFAKYGWIWQRTTCSFTKYLTNIWQMQAYRTHVINFIYTYKRYRVWLQKGCNICFDLLIKYLSNIYVRITYIVFRIIQLFKMDILINNWSWNTLIKFFC